MPRLPRRLARCCTHGRGISRQVAQVVPDAFIVGKLDKLPLFKVEVADAAILAPGVKLRVSGSLNNPSYPAVKPSVGSHDRGAIPAFPTRVRARRARSVEDRGTLNTWRK